MKKAELLPFTVKWSGMVWGKQKRERGIERLLYEIYGDSRSD
jgi:hypothetical protein